MDKHTIFFIGKPGCGKGTQAKLLAEKTGWKIVSSGEYFRAIATEDTVVGRKVKSEINAGFLSPHWFATYLYLKSLFSISSDESVIFDGFCRKVPEAEIIINSLKWLERPFVVLDIKISDGEVKKRLALRKDIEGREDDNAVNERLKEYHEYTDQAIEVFRKVNMIIEINGEQPQEAIAKDIRSALDIK